MLKNDVNLEEQYLQIENDVKEFTLSANLTDDEIEFVRSYLCCKYIHDLFIQNQESIDNKFAALKERIKKKE